MTTPLRVLMLEDSPTDAKLVVHALKAIGRPLAVERVDEGEALERMLATGPWDIVLSDWSMPRFSALDGLARVREHDPDVPFIIVSGTVGEERAVAAMRAGAQDYVLKDNLARLAPAVEREVREGAERARRRAAEAELRLQDTRFRALIERSRDGVLVLSARGAVRYASPQAHLILDRHDPLAGVSFTTLVHPEDVAIVREALARILHVPGATEVREYRTWLRDGGGRWVRASMTNLVDEPAVEGIVVHVSDVDERRTATERLHEAEARYRRIVETTSEGVWTFDLEGVATFVNPRLAELFGRSVDDVMTSALGALLDSASASEVERCLARARERQRSACEIGFMRPDGEARRALVEVAPIVDDDGRTIAGALVLVHDVTAQRRAEEAKSKAEEALARSDEQLRHAQKLEAVGRLAGGVAHDFNNLLSVILSYGAMLLEDLEPDDPMIDDVREICAAGRRAADLTKRLLAFSRQQVVELQVVDLNDLVLGVERLCRRILGEDIELKTELGEGLPRVRIDAGAFEQVVMNLVVNARDAMPHGGRLTIATAAVELDAAFAQSHLGVVPGPHLRLTVRDTGVGMDAVTMQRIFEPFFTTKELGKGTGLGLSMVFGIVKQAGGTIWVDSELGVGSRFDVYLPCVEAAVTEVRARPPITDVRGHETILLVEDDEALRTVARGILLRAGYTVIEADEPRAAIDLVRRGERCDLMLTDVVMPFMSGLELARQVRALRPTLKIVCMSGYTHEAAALQGGEGSGGVPGLVFIDKPLVPEVLLRRLREVFAG